MRLAPVLSLLAAAALLPAVAAAQAAPAPAPAAAPAARPSPAPRKVPKRVTDVSCERYLKLPAHARAMLIGWEAGQTFRKGTFAGWVVDADKAGALASAVEEQCRVNLSASFWYTVKAELKKAR